MHGQAFHAQTFMQRVTKTLLEHINSFRFLP